MKIENSFRGVGGGPRRGSGARSRPARSHGGYPGGGGRSPFRGTEGLGDEGGSGRRAAWLKDATAGVPRRTELLRARGRRVRRGVKRDPADLEMGPGSRS